MYRNYGVGTPAKKALVGNQGNLPEHLKAKIDAAPGKMYDSPAKQSDVKSEEAKMDKVAFDSPAYGGATFKHPKPNFQMHSTDINGMKKKSGFGPKAAKGKDDQSKELAKSKFEMGEYDKDPTSPAKNKKESKVKTTRTKNSITKSDGKTSSTYNIDNSKTKENKDGSKSYTFTNDLGNSINETHSSSPLAQKIIGGTKSKKGNIFTKRGRTQRTINQVGKAKDKLRDNANKEGFDTKKSKRLMKKALKKGEKAVKKVNKYFSRDQYKGVKFAGDDGMDKN